MAVSPSCLIPDFSIDILPDTVPHVAAMGIMIQSGIPALLLTNRFIGYGCR